MSRPYRHFMPRVALAALAVFLAPPALAQDKRSVDLELVLAADGSGSIDDDELRLQREGYGLAMMHPRVLEAIQFGPSGRIAVAYVEWGAPECSTPLSTGRSFPILRAPANSPTR